MRWPRPLPEEAAISILHNDLTWSHVAPRVRKGLESHSKTGLRDSKPVCVDHFGCFGFAQHDELVRFA